MLHFSGENKLALEGVRIKDDNQKTFATIMILDF
jgi:hypothetical protein